MQTKYDIAIIGSGLGGLTCGYILSKNGYKVAIFEQGAQFGGCLQTFKRRGVKFETGVHYIGSVNEGQTLNLFFHYLSLFPDIKLLPLNPCAFDIISFKGEQYQYAVGYENFVETLAQKFPAESDNLKRYAAAMKKIANSSPFHHTPNSDSSSQPVTPMDSSYVTTSVNDFIAGFTSNEVLQNVLVGTIPLYNGVRHKTPLYVHAFIIDSYISGAHRIMGGSDQISDSLVRSIRSFGGELFASSKVTEIIFVKGTYISQVEKVDSYYVVEHRFYKEKTVKYPLIGEIKKSLIPYRKTYAIKYTGNITSNKSYNLKTPRPEPFENLPGKIKKLFKHSEYNVEERFLIFDDIGVDLFMWGGQDPSIPGIAVGQSLLRKILSYCIIYEIIEAEKTKDIYNSKTVRVLPKDLARGIQSALSGYDLSSVVYGEKPELLMPALRLQSWNEAQDHVVKQMATSLSISPTVFSPEFVQGGQKTDDQINQENKLTSEYTSMILNFFETTINKLLFRISKYLKIEPVTIRFGVEKSAPKISDYIDLYGAGLLSKRAVLEAIFPDKTNEQILEIVNEGGVTMG